jgi:hypothetical protein
MPPKNRTGTRPATPINQAPPSNQTKTASEMARACLLRHLQGHFEDFLSEAKLHELYLLDSVLMDFGSGNSGPDSTAAESPLADVFMLALDSDDTYVKVPRDRIALVEDFLETLDSIPDIDEPAPWGRPKLVVSGA